MAQLCRATGNVKRRRRRKEAVKGKVYRAEVIPALFYGLETVTHTKHRAELRLAKLKMLRLSLGIMRMDSIKKEKNTRDE